jgi:hypothetical protein
MTRHAKEDIVGNFHVSSFHVVDMHTVRNAVFRSRSPIGTHLAPKQKAVESKTRLQIPY